MRPTSAFISGMATMGVLAGGIVIGTGTLGGAATDQSAASNPSSSGDNGSTSNSTSNQTSSGTASGGTNTASHQSSGAKDGTFDGPVVDTRYGPMQVEIVIKNGVIESAKTLQQPGSDGESVQINAQVIPILVKATTDYQSVQFGNVSRATISTNAYKQSAQGALDLAGFTG